MGTIKKKVLAHIKTTKIVGAKNELIFKRYKLDINSRKITKDKLSLELTEKETEIISREIANKQLNQFANIYFNKITSFIQFAMDFQI